MIETSYPTVEGHTDEASVLGLARVGDVAAIGSLYEMHHAKIFNYAYGRTGNPEDAADIAQDVFERAIGRLPGFVDSGSGWAPYLTRITQNTIISRYRRSQIHPMYSFDPTEETPRLADTDRPVEDRVADSSRRDHLVAVLRDRVGNHDFLEALIETAVNGLTYHEYAVRKGLPVGTVQSRVYRARHAILQAFPQEHDLTALLAS